MAQPISITTANEMIQAYINYMSNLGVDMQFQTHSVSFGSVELLEWMRNTEQFTDEFRICIGVYPEGSANEGRITTIIWPYRSGSPAMDDEQNEIEPFNEGQRNP